VILSAVYMLWMFQRVNYGDVTNEENRHLPDLTTREWAMMVPTVAIAVLMGVLPGLFLRPMEPSVVKVVDRITGTQPSRAQNGRVAPVPRAPTLEPVTANATPRTSKDPRQASHE
jgi:NADH-quinone oxidoreductase subunit M